MSKKLVIIGNGLGMALNPVHFNLTNAMKRLWQCQERLDKSEKTTIGALKGIDAADGPTSEDHLITTQLALGFLTEFRNQLGQEARDTWLTPNAKNYPQTLRKYIFEVAHELYSYQIPHEKKPDWDNFLKAFLTFVAKTGSHIATLNYDDLLYDAVMNHEIEINGKPAKLSDKKSGKSPYIRDGFLAGGKLRPDSFDYCSVSAYLSHPGR